MESWVKWTSISIIILLAILLPLASTYPDGLEKVVETLGVEEGAPIWRAPMADYTLEVIANSYLSTLAAGLIGFCFVLAVTWILGKAIKARKRE